MTRHILTSYQAARATRMHHSAKEPISPRRGLKRTVGYMAEDDEDNSVPTAKMKRLTVNEALSVNEAHVLGEDSTRQMES